MLEQLILKCGPLHLHSAADDDLAVPQWKLTRKGSQSFSISFFNSMGHISSFVHDPSLTVDQFCSQLKSKAFHRALEPHNLHLHDSLAVRRHKHKFIYLLPHQWQCRKTNMCPTPLNTSYFDSLLYLNLNTITQLFQVVNKVKTYTILWKQAQTTYIIKIK
jgi:hypothetical protein